MRTSSLEHLKANATVNDVCEVMARDGGVIVEDMLSTDLVDRVRGELSPYLDRTPWGDGDFVGFQTRRTSSLLAKSPSSLDLMMQPLFLGASEQWLRDEFEIMLGSEVVATEATITLSVTQAVQIWSGPPQPLHRDDFLHHTRHPGPDSQVQVLYAGNDFTKANGATNVVPGSHLWDDVRKPTMAEAVPAEMPAGSGLIYLGSTYHGGGENVSSSPRTAWLFSYCRGYLRQEENAYLAYPIELVKTFPDRIQRLIGYSMCPPYCGWFEMQDPHVVLEGDASNVRAAHDLF
jgi:ectoine hydroxylase-related dioxygenase (phytanoyl-CoA dioxygenase family)